MNILQLQVSHLNPPTQQPRPRQRKHLFIRHRQPQIVSSQRQNFLHKNLSRPRNLLIRHSRLVTRSYATSRKRKIQIHLYNVSLVIVIHNGEGFKPANLRPHRVNRAFIFFRKEKAAFIDFSFNPKNSVFVGPLTKIFEAFFFYPFLFRFTYVGRLHAAAGSAVFAFEPYRIGDGYIFEVQGVGGGVKMVYLGCVVKNRFDVVLAATAPVFCVKI
jgi:hypothetical protein